MKDAKSSITTLLIVFITLKLIEFSNMNILDYLLVIVVAIYVVVEILDIIKRRGNKNG